MAFAKQAATGKLEAPLLQGIIEDYLAMDGRPHYSPIVDLAAVYLGKMAAADALPALNQLVRTEPWYAQAAVASIGAIGGPDALTFLLERFTSSDADPISEKVYLPSAMARIGGVRAADALAKALSDDDATLADAVRKSFRAIGHQASMAVLVQALERAMGSALPMVMEAVERKADTRAVPALLGKLVYPKYTRMEAARILQQLGEPKYAAAVCGQDEDIDRLTELAGMETVLMWVRDAQPAIQNALHSPYGREAGLASALAMVGCETGRHCLLAMLSDASGGVRRVAAGRLHRLGEPSWQTVFNGDDDDPARFAAACGRMDARDVIQVFNAAQDDMRLRIAEQLLVAGSPEVKLALHHGCRTYAHTDMPPGRAEGVHADTVPCAEGVPADRGEDEHFDLQAARYFSDLSMDDW